MADACRRRMDRVLVELELELKEAEKEVERAQWKVARLTRLYQKTIARQASARAAARPKIVSSVVGDSNTIINSTIPRESIIGSNNTVEDSHFG